MAVTRVRVLLHNETDQPLVLVSTQIVDGEWGVGAPGQVEARSVATRSC